MKELFFLIILFAVVNSFAQTKTESKYDFSCLDSDGSSIVTNVFGDLEKDMLNNYGLAVSIEEEEKIGEIVFKECEKEFKFFKLGKEIENLKSILKKLAKNIDKPKGFKYEIFLLDTTMLNAFTAGGKIFFTTEMYRFCKSNDEIAAIIGHEIYHNELGHISDQIKREKTANSFFGEQIGSISSFLGKILTTPFNQKNEAHCDLTGTDLINKAGFKPCSTVILWNRMKENEGQYNEIEFIFNSHPYSGKRAVCTSEHLKINYSIICEE